tara:strand:+ start:314 stop:1096 length:783 start_codon:yes stop_codon:yes gene_type:complete
MKKKLGPIYYGNLADFNKYIGPRLRNIIPPLTKKYKKAIGKCEHCSNSSIELQAAHRHSFNRKKIIKENLETCKVDEEFYKVDLKEFENLYVESHKPISKVFIVLCDKCHRKYDNLNRKKPIKIKSNLDKASIMKNKQRPNRKRVKNFIQLKSKTSVNLSKFNLSTITNDGRFWVEPKFDVTQSHWSLALINTNKKYLSFFIIPPNSKVYNNLYKREDKGCYSLIFETNDMTFREDKSYQRFDQFLVGTFEYSDEEIFAI